MMSEIAIVRTWSPQVIRELAVDPAIFPHLCDDFTRDRTRWQPSMSAIVVNLVARDRHGYLGFGIFIPRTYSCFDAHVGFLPRSYGEAALISFRCMLAWMFENTTAARIVGEIDIENRRAIAFAKRAGFEEYGVNEKSRLRGGILRDQVCLGISRP